MAGPVQPAFNAGDLMTAGGPGDLLKVTRDPFSQHDI